MQRGVQYGRIRDISLLAGYEVVQLDGEHAVIGRLARPAQERVKDRIAVEAR